MKPKGRVLVVDNDRLAMAGYVETLRSAGFDVHQCYDPDESLQYVSAHSDSLDAVVLDIMLPTGDCFTGIQTMNGLTTGLHLFRDLKKRYPDLPIIFLTHVSKSDPLAEILQNFKDIPQEIILEKLDFGPNAFVERLESLIDLIRASASLREG